MNIHEKINARSYLTPKEHTIFGYALKYRIERPLAVLPTTHPCANDIGWQHANKKNMFKLKF